MEQKRGKKRWLILLALVLVLAAVSACQVSAPPILRYKDHIVRVHRGIAVNILREEHFSKDARGRLSCQKAGVRAREGVDVSYYQGAVDWQKVKEDGIDFALIRLGFRGYTQGELHLDERFEENYANAAAAGLELGAYFFAQATTPQEAEEEAEFVLSALNGRPLQYPVVYDWETIDPGKEARTEGMTGEEITACAAAFCKKIEEAGYRPMVYFNTSLGYLGLNLSRLKGYPFWLAQYQDHPEFYYRFDLWQYTHQGQVNGIPGRVDLNLDLTPFY